jgi:hypothetical protein
VLDKDGKPIRQPMFFVFSNCTTFLRTVPVLQHDPAKPEDLDTASEDHVADEVRYACSSRPWTRTIKAPEIPKDAYREMRDDTIDVHPV